MLTLGGFIKCSQWPYNKETKQTWLTVCLMVLMQIQLLPLFSDRDVIASRGDLPAGRQEQSEVQANYASLPLAFEPNLGQVDPSAQFLVHHGQATTYFDGTNTTTIVGDSHVTMGLDGANSTNFAATDQLESKTNYFIGNDQSKWQSDVPNYKSLLAKNVYPGIDLKYYGTNSQLEHDFIVSPNTDYQQIIFHFNGQENILLDADGNLVLKTKNGDLRLNAPTTYQQTNHEKRTIPSHFELNDNTITFALNADYDHSQPLIIDPSLVYSTYLGGNSTDTGYDIAIDTSGNAYLTGQTNSSNFPTASPFQAANGGGGLNDTFVTKMNATGSALIYSTYLGGSGADGGRSIVIDSSNNAYITGQTSSTNFPTSAPFQAANGGTSDAFVTKLNAAGSGLTYSTYLGGSGNDYGLGLAIDSSNNVYLSGQTLSTNFPTSSPFQAANGGGSGDAFIAKMNTSGSALTYSTYLGGSGDEFGIGIALDSSNNVYLTGNTTSTNFPTASPLQGSTAGLTDTFITKLNAAGSALTYSTYLGGSAQDFGVGIAVDTGGSAYISGYTTSTNFPTTSPFQASKAGGSYDIFVTKLNSAGSARIYSTYLGGSGDEYSYGIAVDTYGNAYLDGYTDSTNFPVSSAIQSTNAGSNDAFVTKFNSAGSALTYSTYLGGSSNDFGYGLAIDITGNAFVTGQTSSTNFPTAGTPFQATRGAGNNAFVTQITEHAIVVTGQIAPTLSFAIGSVTCDLGVFSVTTTKSCTHTIAASTNAQSGYVISYIPTTTLTSGANTITAMASQAASVVGSEQFGLNLKANTTAGSFTAADFGADPSGGIGTVATGYSIADQFKFATAGANVAQSTGASATTTYTASFIANIAVTTEAGTYSTPVTYNIIATY
jgi:hypothetical protein